MNSPTILELYKAHKGKVSDKWSIYLSEYHRLFGHLRNENVSLLEIGIQNGGSLEIWSQYFQNAKVLIGCDINPDCSKLTYKEDKIKIIVGDASEVATASNIMKLSSEFDIVIDDGSHKSGDIIKNFNEYFGFIKNGGLFVAEDLHCSYWKDFEGGLCYPFSAIEFFKLLADIINYEHWGVKENRIDLLVNFQRKYDIKIKPELLESIHSVEFINSLCIIRKAASTENSLGFRKIAGQTEAVVMGHLELSGKSYLENIKPSEVESESVFDLLNMKYANIFHKQLSEVKFIENSLYLQEQYELTLTKLHELKSQHELILRNLSKKDAELLNIYNSKSWKLTIPLRKFKSIVFRKKSK